MALAQELSVRALVQEQVLYVPACQRMGPPLAGALLHQQTPRGLKCPGSTVLTVCRSTWGTFLVSAIKHSREAVE